MKKALLITFLISIFITGFQSTPQNNAEAVEYFENIYNIIREVNVRDLQYSKSIIYQRRNSKVERKRDNVVSETKEAIAKLKAMPSFEGDSNLRDISIEVLRSKLDIMSVKLVKISKMQESAYNSYEALEEYYEESNEVMEELAGEFEKLGAAQIQFASDNGFTLDENRTRLAKQLTTIAILNDYIQPIYLAVFKVEKEVAAYYDALNERDFDAAEVSREQIITDSKISIRAIAKSPGYKGNKYFNGKASNMVRFYEGQAKTTFVKLQELLKKGDKMSKAEYKEFNSLINKYNKESKEAYNKYNSEYYNFQQKYVSRI